MTSRSWGGWGLLLGWNLSMLDPGALRLNNTDWWCWGGRLGVWCTLG